MTPKFDGGGAFPSQPVYQTPHGAIGMTSQNGMTLRDWFAGQALGGIAFDCGLSSMEAAEKAYEMADAMIAGRSKP